jgi:hypothetical protein
VTTADRSPLVRPQFIKWSVVVFVLLLPFVAHAAFDYAETQRLGASIAKIRARHEPLTSQEIQPPVILTGAAADAARYYRGAAAVVGPEWDEEQRTRLRARIADALWSGTWPNALVADLRSRVSRDEDVYRLLDRATPLAFEGFGAGSNPSVRAGEMQALARVAPLRTRLLAFDGNGNGAAASLYAELRLLRTLDVSYGPFIIAGFTEAGLADSLRLIVNRSHPDEAALSKLATRLREMDRDDVLKMYLLRARASIFDTGTYQGVELLNAGRVQSMAGSAVLMRPWMMARLNERVDTLNALITVADGPWPGRMDPPLSAYISNSPRWGNSRLSDTWRMTGLGGDVATIRCARIVVAVERYRLAYGPALPPRLEDLVPSFLDAVPIDPFSAKPLRFLTEEGGYVVYSFGLNRRDDGGRLATKDMVRQRFVDSAPPAADLGIRIAHR